MDIFYLIEKIHDFFKFCSNGISFAINRMEMFDMDNFVSNQ